MSNAAPIEEAARVVRESTAEGDEPLCGYFAFVLDTSTPQFQPINVYPVSSLAKAYSISVVVWASSVCV